MARSSSSLLKTLGLLALIASLALVSRPTWAEDADEGSGVEDDEYADVERAHLVVRKHAHIDNDGLVVQGRNITLTVTISNIGSSSASNVKVADTLPEDSTLIDGTLEHSVARIGVGSAVAHSYVIVFNKGSVQVQLPPAVVSYTAEADSTSVQTGLSSTQLMYVMTPVQQITRYALKVGVYASLGFARTPSEWRNLAIVVGTVGSLLGANWAVKKFGIVQTNRKRERALKELQKDD